MPSLSSRVGPTVGLIWFVVESALPGPTSPSVLSMLAFSVEQAHLSFERPPDEAHSVGKISVVAESDFHVAVASPAEVCHVLRNSL
jgi:hypothetical protein